METIGRVLEQEQASTERRKLPSGLEEVSREIESLYRRLDLLAQLQSLLKNKYRNKLVTLFEQLNSTDRQRCGIKSLAKQLKRSKERQSILKREMADLERHKKTIRETIKQVLRYEKSSSEQVDVLEIEREVLHQQVQDLMQTLELAEQAELTEKELTLIRQKVYASKGLVEEQERGLRKRTIDLLFELYIPPRNKKLGW